MYIMVSLGDSFTTSFTVYYGYKTSYLIVKCTIYTDYIPKNCVHGCCNSNFNMAL